MGGGASQKRNCTETATGRRQGSRRSKACSGPAGDRGPWTWWPFSEGAVLVATKADARSIAGEPDPRGFSSENAGKRRPLLRRRLKARNWMPCCGSHRRSSTGEEEILSSGSASGRQSRNAAPAPCTNAMLPTGSCLGFGGQPVLPCPSQLPSGIMSRVKIWLHVPCNKYGFTSTATTNELIPSIYT